MLKTKNMKTKKSRGAVLLMALILVILSIGLIIGLWPTISVAVATVSILFIVAGAIITLVDALMWSDDSISSYGPLRLFYVESADTEADDDGKPKKKRKNIVKRFIIGILFVSILIYLISLIKPVYNDCAFTYNKSKVLHNNYTQAVQERAGFYDKMWKTYLQKDKITSVNKDVFIQVAKVIMENRKDGDKVMWKWVRENQQIPFEEFTKFYVDLSNFIESQREAYYNIEKVCQGIANQNNTLLDTFPHNLYNKFLKCKPINFEYGMLSDSTNKVFTTKIENVK